MGEPSYPLTIGLRIAAWLATKMNRKLYENLGSLFSIQALNYILPLATLPFLARVLGPVNWGILAFAEGYASYVSLIVDYGFGLSASRDIAQMRDDKQYCSEYLSNVLTAQAALGIGSLCLSGLLIQMVPGGLSNFRPLLPIASLLAFCRSAFPGWFFQGQENMRLIAILNIGSNVIASLSIFALVRTSGDTSMVLGVRTLAAVASTAAALVLVYRSFPLARPSAPGVLEVLKRGGTLFLFKGIISLYTTANVLFLGVIAAPVAVAWFAGAEKLCKAALNALGPINQTFYPRINYLLKSDPKAAVKTIRISILLTTSVGCLAGIFLFVFAPSLVKLLLGNSFAQAIPILRVMSLLPPLIAVSNALGVQWMIPLRMEKTFTCILFVASVSNLALALYLVPGRGPIGMAISVVAAETIVTIGVAAALIAKGQNPFLHRVREERIAA